MKKIILWILVISWMGVIFCLSNDNAVESTNKSRAIINNTKIIEKYDVSENEKEIIITNADNQLRKAAHSIVFCVLGFIVCFLLKEYNLKFVKIAIYCLLICFLYSISDECHQLFIDGRSAELSDIILDNIGSIIGIIMFYLFGYKKWNKK